MITLEHQGPRYIVRIDGVHVADLFDASNSLAIQRTVSESERKQMVRHCVEFLGRPLERVTAIDWDKS